MDKLKLFGCVAATMIVSVVLQLTFFSIVYNEFLVRMGANPVNLATIFGAVLLVRYFRGPKDKLVGTDWDKWFEKSFHGMGFTVAGILVALATAQLV